MKGEKGKKIEVDYIETNVPIPVRVGYPLESLEVGESFLFPENKRDSVQARASRLKKATKKEFTVKKVSIDTCRVWRTK